MLSSILIINKESFHFLKCRIDAECRNKLFQNPLLYYSSDCISSTNSDRLDLVIHYFTQNVIQITRDETHTLYSLYY